MKKKALGVKKSKPLAEPSQTSRFHMKWGWWSLLVFLTLGIALETLHAWKSGYYLDVSNSTRRLMWTLAHAHGVLLALVHIAFAQTVSTASGWKPASRVLASRCLLGAGILMPVGFFLGGIVIYSGDPGLGALLVPPGGILLFVAVFLTARAVTKG